jgi:hypothetical protein
MGTVCVRILSRDPLINVEQIAILLTNGLQTEAVNGIRGVQVDSLPVRPKRRALRRRLP